MVERITWMCCGASHRLRSREDRTRGKGRPRLHQRKVEEYRRPARTARFSEFDHSFSRRGATTYGDMRAASAGYEESERRTRPARWFPPAAEQPERPLVSTTFCRPVSARLPGVGSGSGVEGDPCLLAELDKRNPRIQPDLGLSSVHRGCRQDGQDRHSTEPQPHSTEIQGLIRAADEPRLHWTELANDVFPRRPPPRSATQIRVVLDEVDQDQVVRRVGLTRCRTRRAS